MWRKIIKLSFITAKIRNSKSQIYQLRSFETNTIGLTSGSMAGRQKLQNGIVDKKKTLTDNSIEFLNGFSKALAVNHSKEIHELVISLFCIAFLYLILQYHESNHYSPSC